MAKRSIRRRMPKRPRRKMNKRGSAARRCPPPINIDPWFKVTLSFEDVASGNMDCMVIDDVFKSLDSQLDFSRTGKYYVLKIHRIRVWNVSGGPLFLEPCQLIEKHGCQATTLPLRSIEVYAGRASWAYAQFTWPRSQSSIEQDDNANTGVVFVRKAHKSDKLVIHLVVSFKITKPNSFKLANFRPPVLSSEARCNVDNQPTLDEEFVKVSMDSDTSDVIPRKSARIMKRKH